MRILQRPDRVCLDVACRKPGLQCAAADVGAIRRGESKASKRSLAGNSGEEVGRQSRASLSPCRWVIVGGALCVE